MTPPTTQEAGLKLVPTEPTEAMLRAGEKAAWDDDSSMPAIRAMPKAWAAMLAAAPTPEPIQADLREAEEIVRRWANWIIDESADMEADDHDAGKRKVRAERDLVLAAMQAKSAPVAWRSMTDAPKDRTPIRALIHADLYPRVKPNRDDLERWNGQEIVIHHPGLASDGFDIGWSLTAPVGHGGFPDEWFVGWLPTGAHPYPSAPNPDLAGLVEARAWAEKTLRNTLLDDPDDDRHLRAFLTATTSLK